MPRRRHLRRSAFGQNPEFYKFYRSLEAYRATFKNQGDVMVVDPARTSSNTSRAAARPLAEVSSTLPPQAGLPAGPARRRVFGPLLLQEGGFFAARGIRTHRPV
jgi:hypothetical protein